MAASQRARIVDAMTAAVGEGGYHGTRVADIVWRAGVSRKTFYELFVSKEECFAATYEQWIDRLLVATLEAYRGPGAWTQRLRSALATLLDSLAREPDVARLCFVEAIGAGDEVARRRDLAMEGFGRLFDAPDIRTARLAETLRAGRVGELSEMLRHEIVAGRAAQLPQLVPELMYAMALPFVGAEAASAELDPA